MKENKSKQTLLTFEKVLVQGEQMLKLISFENVLPRDQLPLKYFTSQPRYERYNDNEIYILSGCFGNVIRLGDSYTVEFINEQVKCMKMAGERLTTINKEISKLASEWNSGKTTTIKI